MDIFFRLWDYGLGSMSPQIPPGGAHGRHLLNTAPGSVRERQVASCGAGLENPAEMLKKTPLVLWYCHIFSSHSRPNYPKSA